MKENGNKIKEMDMEFNGFQMAQYTKVSGSKINKQTASSLGKIKHTTKASSTETSSKVKALL